MNHESDGTTGTGGGKGKGGDSLHNGIPPTPEELQAAGAALYTLLKFIKNSLHNGMNVGGDDSLHNGGHI